LMRAGQARAKGQTSDEIECGFRAELADVLAHTLLIAQRFGVDMETEIHSKWLMRNPDKVMQS
jgi:NTP pyrophosphatase (non-canonical NTP hydrolase)